MAESSSVPRVLLAEDDDDMRALLAHWLRAQGFLVLEVADGVSLTESLCGELAWDLVVSDVRLPKRSGLAAVREMRGLGRRTPVILMTAFSAPSVRREANALNAALLDKPFELVELSSEIGRLIAAERG